MNPDANSAHSPRDAVYQASFWTTGAREGTHFSSCPQAHFGKPETLCHRSSGCGQLPATAMTECRALNSAVTEETPSAVFELLLGFTALRENRRWEQIPMGLVSSSDWPGREGTTTYHPDRGHGCRGSRRRSQVLLRGRGRSTWEAPGRPHTPHGDRRLRRCAQCQRCLGRTFPTRGAFWGGLCMLPPGTPSRESPGKLPSPRHTPPSTTYLGLLLGWVCSSL